MPASLWLSILPSTIAIVLAMFTRQVIPSLLVGLWVGGFIVSPGLLPSVSKTVSYISAMLTDASNLDVLLFLYVFSGLVAIIQIAGGVKGFANYLGKFMKNKRQVFLASWALEPITFIDCGFRVVASGSIIKSLAKKFEISGERLAYMLNNSASPVIALIPIATTYVGYMLGVIRVGMRTAGVDGSPFLIFLQTIPLNFFSWVSITIAVGSIFSPWQFPAMAKAEKMAENDKNDPKNKETSRKLQPALSFESSEEISHNADAAKDQMGVSTGKVSDAPEEHEHDKRHKKTKPGHVNMEHDHEMEVEPKLKPRMTNLLVPIALLIVLSFFMVWWDGRAKGDTLLEIFANANASRAMFLALFLTTIFTSLFYLVQGLRLRDISNQFIKGGNKLMVTIVILTVAWPIANVSNDLGLPKLITATLGTSLPAVWVPVTIFVVTGLVTYFIGSSWGAWALMMPLGLSLAATVGASIPLTAAAVFSGGTFGDVTSPLSGMAAMSSGIAEVEHMDYVRAMTPYNLTAAIVSAGLFLLVPLMNAV